jgi:hypothetical protein
VETELKKVGKVLPTKVVTPMTADYHPELDQSKELGPDQVTYFAGLIGVLHWCIKLGRIDIIVEVSLLSRFLECPHKGHMQQAFHVFGYLPAIIQSHFQVVDLSEFYPQVGEAIPRDAPELRGVSVVTSCFVDSNHAGCRLTRQSHTGVFHLCEQRADLGALQEAEYSGIINTLFQVCGAADSSGHD